jgi:5-methylthioadenosine/S-adenosylhomocysteine deaminase
MRLYLNLDHLVDPEQEGSYIEIKSRTWSMKDAESKAAAILDLLAQLGIDHSNIILDEYVSLTEHD